MPTNSGITPCEICLPVPSALFVSDLQAVYHVEFVPSVEVGHQGQRRFNEISAVCVHPTHGMGRPLRLKPVALAAKSWRNLPPTKLSPDSCGICNDRLRV